MGKKFQSNQAQHPAAVNLWYWATSGGQTNTQLQDSSHSAADTYSSVMFLSLDLASLIFSCRFLSIFFLRSFFSLWRATQREWGSKKQNKSSTRVCVRTLTRRMYVKTVLLLTDVSELFELGALAFLRYRGQLLNQLHGDRRGESHFSTISDIIPYFEWYLPLAPTKYAEIERHTDLKTY